MRREDIQRALEAASAVSSHHEFVIAGSLSVLGLPATTYYDDEDRRKTANGLLMHRIAMQSDGSLAKGLLEYMHANPPEQKIQEVDLDHGEYVGRILWSDRNYMVQSLERGDIVIHPIRDWATQSAVDSLALITGLPVTMSYRDGTPTLKVTQPEQDRSGPFLGC